jgi:hypothetical protein
MKKDIPPHLQERLATFLERRKEVEKRIALDPEKAMREMITIMKIIVGTKPAHTA